MKTGSSYNDYLLFALITRLDVKPDRIVDVLNSQIQRLPHHNPRDHHHHHKHKHVRNCSRAEKKKLIGGGGYRSICSICFDLKSEPDMFRGGACNHPVCAECISKHVVDHIQGNVMIVNCPISTCGVGLVPENLHGLLPKGVIVRWEYAISSESSSPAWKQKACEELKEVKQAKDSDRKVLKLAKTKVPKICPKCSVYVQKCGGSEHVACRCGCHFCYNCGGKWKLGHKCTIFQRWQNNWRQLVREISRRF